MFTKILAASTLALGLAMSTAMAQTVVTDEDVYDGSGAVMQDDTMTVDPATTQSIYPDDGMGMNTRSGTISTGILGPCASEPGMGPDANASPGVNDQYCGK